MKQQEHGDICQQGPFSLCLYCYIVSHCDCMSLYPVTFGTLMEKIIIINLSYVILFSCFISATSFFLKLNGFLNLG